MGQATILSHLGGGLYRVKLLFANGIVTARIAAIGLQITALDAQIADLEGQKNAAYADLQTALDAMNAYLGSVTPEQLATDPTTINALTKAAFTARAHYDTLAMRWRMAKSKRTALETNRSYLQNYCPSDITVDAWSVRFNEDLTGNAATIEVDYVLQRNSGTGQSVVNDSGVWLLPGAGFDSKLQHPLASSEHATWFNLCILPAMQRDAPRYRVATLSNLNKLAGTCTVEFDGSSSFDENKLVSENPIYPHGAQSTGATISYPPCNGAAFENGDRVIVAGGNVAGNNTVIGFHSNPRECPPFMAYVIEFKITIRSSNLVDLSSVFSGNWPISESCDTPIDYAQDFQTQTISISDSYYDYTIDEGVREFVFDRAPSNSYELSAINRAPKITPEAEYGSPKLTVSVHTRHFEPDMDIQGVLWDEPQYCPTWAKLASVSDVVTGEESFNDHITAHSSVGGVADYTAYAIYKDTENHYIMRYVRDDLLDLLT